MDGYDSEEELMSYLLSRVKRSKSKGKRIIGIGGMQKGLGMTHTALMISTHLADIKREKTAYVELSQKNQIITLKDTFAWSQRSETSLTHRNLTLYYNAGLPMLLQILQEDYQNLVLDFGTEALEQYKEELFHCDLKLMLLSNAIWKKQEVKNFLSRVSNIYGAKDWDFLFPCISMEDKRELTKLFGIHTDVIPYLENPFQISTSCVKVLDHILHCG